MKEQFNRQLITGLGGGPSGRLRGGWERGSWVPQSCRASWVINSWLAGELHVLKEFHILHFWRVYKVGPRGGKEWLSAGKGFSCSSWRRVREKRDGQVKELGDFKQSWTLGHWIEKRKREKSRGGEGGEERGGEGGEEGRGEERNRGCSVHKF